MEASGSEPLMRHRKDKDEVKTELLYRVQDELGGRLAYRPIGFRCKGGVNLIQAFARNLGTCRSDDKGEAQVEDPQG
jgi:hypothetical protein